MLLVVLFGQFSSSFAQQVYVKRTYYDYNRQHLHEEYQFIRTANKQEVKNGYYKEYDEQGVLWKKGTYRNGHAEGRQLEYLNVDGQPQLQYDITVRNNVAHGPYIRYKGPNDKMSAGTYVNGSREGTWTFYYAEGYEVCTYQNDAKEGPAALYYAGGKLAEQYTYRNDKRYNDGDTKSFYEDGRPKKSGHFTDGLMDGKFLAWYPNGQLRYEENYVNDIPQGRFLAYSEDGQLTTDDTYADGQLIEHKKTAQEIAEEAQRQELAAQQQRRQQEQQAAEQAYRQAEAARQQQVELEHQASSLAYEAAHKQEMMRNEAAVGYRRQLDTRLYVEVYQQVLTEYQAATTPSAKLAQAQRLEKLLKLTEQLERGEQPELKKALRKATDLTTIQTLIGL